MCWHDKIWCSAALCRRHKSMKSCLKQKVWSLVDGVCFCKRAFLGFSRWMLTSFFFAGARFIWQQNTKKQIERSGSIGPSSNAVCLSNLRPMSPTIQHLPRQATTPSTPLLYATLLWASLVLGSFSSSTPLLYTALLLDSSSSSTVFVVIFQGPNVESLSTQHRLISKVFIFIRNRSVYWHRLILTITIICIYYTEYTNATVYTNL